MLLISWNISQVYSTFVGFTDGANHHTWNLASTTWVIYFPTRKLVASGGACLDPSTNKMAEYSAIIELLRDSIMNHIRSLVIYLDAQFILSQLNDKYHVLNPILCHRFLLVRFLEHFFSIILLMFMLQEFPIL
jgi:ribonuclease HI